jgi:multidrug efflux pump subunit AcrA (membrane-fusion protein)
MNDRLGIGARSLASSVSLVAIAAASGAFAADTGLATLTTAYESAPRERVWDGTVEAVNRATVSAQTSGRVAAILYDVDDFVEAGAVIMRFTDTEQRAALGRAQAAAQEAEARFTEAESEQRRIAAMFESGTVAKARCMRVSCPSATSRSASSCARASR